MKITVAVKSALTRREFSLERLPDYLAVRDDGKIIGCPMGAAIIGRYPAIIYTSNLPNNEGAYRLLQNEWRWLNKPCEAPDGIILPSYYPKKLYFLSLFNGLWSLNYDIEYVLNVISESEAIYA